MNMKLTNWQADALVAKMKAQFNEKNKKQIAEAQKKVRKANIDKARGFMKIYKTIPQELRGIMYSSRNLSIEKILDNMTTKKRVPEFDSHDAREKVLMASFDAKNIGELKKAIGIS